MLIVQKFGGTSVGGIDRIRAAAGKVAREVRMGRKVVVVVSAMSGVTDQLVSYVKNFTLMQNPEELAEYDAVVSSGEQVTCGLMALALQEINIKSRSFCGWQVPIVTDDSYSRARVKSIDPRLLHDSIEQGYVPVVAGFQGVDRADNPSLGRVTTLGRGGSDTSAVALAAALQADQCDIYTDVDGVYTADPRIVSSARKIDKISYEEMLELASLGAKVLQTRSVEMAMNHKVRLRVLSSFADIDQFCEKTGTLVVSEDEIVEQKRVTGVTCSLDEVRITLSGIPNVPGMSAALFGPLADSGINVDMIVQNVRPDGEATDITFTVPKADYDLAIKVVGGVKGVLGYNLVTEDRNVSKISVVGVGMRSHTGVAQMMFSALASKGINIIVISTSEIKISVLISADYSELALRVLHQAYNLSDA